jgi:hypothetical protein
MILPLLVIDVHEEASVLYTPVWFSFLTHNEFAIFWVDQVPLPPSLFRTSEKANDDKFRKDLLRAHEGKPKYGRWKARDAE